MKVLLVLPAGGEYVETNEGPLRRYSSDNWEMLMGESWEAVYNPVSLLELESAYQLFKNKE